MHSYYADGLHGALASFGLEKVAITLGKLPPIPVRPTRTPLELPAAPSGAMVVEPGLGGSPGMAAGFGGRGVPMEASLTRAQDALSPQPTARGNLARSMVGMGSIPGQAAMAERLYQRSSPKLPTALYPGRNVLAHLLLSGHN